MTEDRTHTPENKPPQHDGGRIVATDVAEHDQDDDAENTKPEDPRQFAERPLVADNGTSAPDQSEIDLDDEDIDPSTDPSI